MSSAALGLSGTAAFSRGLQPLLSPPSPLFPIWEKPVTYPEAEKGRSGPRREAIPGGQQGARPARQLPGLHGWGATGQGLPHTPSLGEGSCHPAPGLGKVHLPGSTRVCQPKPRTGSQGQPPQARLLGVQALGSTLQMRKLRPFSYKWQMGLGLEPGLSAPSLHQVGRWTGWLQPHRGFRQHPDP